MELVSKRDLADVTVHTQTVDLKEGTKEVELYIDRRDLTDAKVASADVLGGNNGNCLV